MDMEFFTNQMANHAAAIRDLVAGISPEQARWKPNPESWSILEVINHLYDEEHQDFRVRVDYILHHPGESWPPIDPRGWVTERGYNQRDPAHSLENFLQERQESLAWLKGLEHPDWQTSATVSFGTFSAGDIFAAWVAHDLLHLRQLVELHWFYMVKATEPYKVDYAGEW